MSADEYALKHEDTQDLLFRVGQHFARMIKEFEPFIIELEELREKTKLLPDDITPERTTYATPVGEGYLCWAPKATPSSLDDLIEILEGLRDSFKEEEDLNAE